MGSKKMFKGIVVAISLLMVFSLFAGCTSSKETVEAVKEEVKAEEKVEEVTEESNESAEKIVIKFADMHVPETIVWQAVEKWKVLMEEKVGDKVEIQLYPSAQLGGQRELIESVKLGTIQLTYANPPLLSNLVPKFGVMDMPYMFDDYAHIERVCDNEVGTILNDALVEEQGMRMLGWYHIGFRDMVTNGVEITSLEDFKGVKFRSPEADTFIGLFKSLGAAPTPIPWPEVYQAMKTNVVDGLETTPEGVTSNKLYEVSDRVILTSHINTVEGPLINEDFYNSLPEDVRTAMVESFKEVEVWQRQEQIAANEKAYKTLEEEGIMLVEIDREPLRAACAPFWDEYSGKNEGVSELIELIQKAR